MPEEDCGGRNLARWVSRAYGAFRFCQVMGALVSDGAQFAWCSYILEAMNYADGTWERLTAPNDRTDGLVQGASQVYPLATSNFPIPGGDSHAGEPNSDRTRAKIEEAFDLIFQVPRY
jgi:hypothetical protein